MIRKNLHILLLKFAFERGEFLPSEINDRLSLSKEERQLLYGKLIHQGQLFQNTGSTRRVRHGRESIYVISTEGRFRLLDHQQLETTKRLSFIAISVSVTAVIVAIVSVFVR